VETYLVDYVEKGWSVVPRETRDHISPPLVREDCLDKRGEFILGNGMTCQALPRLFIVNGSGWVEGITRMLFWIQTRQG